MCLVYGGTIMERTNIVPDERLLQQGKKLTRLKTSREPVHPALSQLVRREKQKKILDLEGKISWVGNLESMRSARGL